MRMRVAAALPTLALAMPRAVAGQEGSPAYPAAMADTTGARSEIGGSSPRRLDTRGCATP